MHCSILHDSSVGVSPSVSSFAHPMPFSTYIATLSFTDARGSPPLFLNLCAPHLSAHKCKAQCHSQLIRLLFFFFFFPFTYLLLSHAHPSFTPLTPHLYRIAFITPHICALLRCLPYMLHCLFHVLHRCLAYVTCHHVMQCTCCSPSSFIISLLWYCMSAGGWGSGWMWVCGYGCRCGYGHR